MINTEKALQERIKELTCLYEVSSIIVNADLDEIKKTFKAISFSPKKAFQFPDLTEIAIYTPIASTKTGQIEEILGLESDINIFNKPKEKIIASLTNNKKRIFNRRKAFIGQCCTKALQSIGAYRDTAQRNFLKEANGTRRPFGYFGRAYSWHST